MRGGWTSHFTWKLVPGEEVCLDVFGIAPRASSACAEEHLPQRPLADYGLARIVREVRETVAVTIGPDVVEWLPDAGENFHGLTP